MEREMAEEMEQGRQHRTEACLGMRRRELDCIQSTDHTPKRRNRRVEVGQHDGLGGWLDFGEFALALAHVTRAAELGSDEVIQVPGQMKDQVADRIAWLDRFAP